MLVELKDANEHLWLEVLQLPRNQNSEVGSDKNWFPLYFGIASLKCKHLVIFSIWSQFLSLGNERNYRRWLWVLFHKYFEFFA